MGIPDIKQHFEKQYPQNSVPDDYFITFEEYAERQRHLENTTGMKHVPIAILFSIYDKRYKYSYDGDSIQKGDIVLVFREIPSNTLHFIAERNLDKLQKSHEYVDTPDDSVVPNFKMTYETKKKILEDDVVIIYDLNEKKKSNSMEKLYD
jgi:hypothetical protein